jgi:hypothetical protein
MRTGVRNKGKGNLEEIPPRKEVVKYENQFITEFIT